MATLGRPQGFNVGPVSFRTDAADIRYVTWAQTELVRRIFITARDRDWQEVPPSSWSWSASHEAESLSLRFAARHTGNGIDFCWRGWFSIDVPARSLSFSFTGTALSDMEICRLGLVVLHPLEALVGGTVETSGPSGKGLHDINEQIHPQPILGGYPGAITAPFKTLNIQSRVGDTFQFDFTGDLFELEDQRNWCDASFKSYCTPLSFGSPRLVDAGDRIAHRVDVLASLTPNRSTEPAHGDSVSFQPVAAGRRLPDLGVCIDPSAVASTHWERSSAFTHIRIDLASTASSEDLTRAERLLLTGERLELGLAVTAEEIPAELLTAIGVTSAPIRILLLQKGQALIDPVLGKRATDELRSHGCDAAIFTAIDDHFVELNRSIPRPITGTGIALLASPSVHSSDVLTAAENVPALRCVIQTARILHPGLEVVVSPLAPSIASVPTDEAWQNAALAWFVASYDTLTTSDVTSVTVARELLPRRRGQDPLAAAWSEVLEALARARDGILLTASVTAGSPLHVLGWQNSAGAVEFLAVNLADKARKLRVVEPPSGLLSTGHVIWGVIGDGEEPALRSALTVPGYGVLQGSFSPTNTATRVHDPAI